MRTTADSIVRLAAALSLVAATSCQAEERDVALAPAWPDVRSVASADGSFALRYPRGAFPEASASGDGITLSSGRADDVHAASLTKLRSSLLDAVRDLVGAGVFRARFPDGTEASFRPDPGFLERERGEGRAHGFRISDGAGGTELDIHVFETGDGRRWRFECIDSGAGRAALCKEVMLTFQGDRAR